MSHAADPRARVQHLVTLARRVADPSDTLGIEARRELGSTSELSPEGVEYALEHALETTATDAELASLLAWAGSAPRCHVVASSNVCTAAVRAIALGLATSSTVLVKPSRREPGLAPLLARALDPRVGTVTLVDRLDAAAGDHVHAYGSDASLDAIRSELPAGVTLRSHGTGFGVAFVGEAADLDDAARGLARDVVLFDQRGCLSPRVAFVFGAARAPRFAAALDEALGALGRAVPPGPAARRTREEVHAYASAMQAVGAVLENDDHLVTLDEAPEGWLLPPAARVMAVLALDSLENAFALLAGRERFITNVGIAAGSADLERRLASHLPEARRASLGRMQSPPLDGPVDRRKGPG